MGRLGSVIVRFGGRGLAAVSIRFLYHARGWVFVAPVRVRVDSLNSTRAI